MELIGKMDKMIKINKNNILAIAYKQDEIFRKYKTNNQFISVASAFKISKVTINFGNYKIKSEWKIQLTIAIHFISSKPDFDEARTMHTKSNNEEIMIGSEANEVIGELFKSLFQKY